METELKESLQKQAQNEKISLCELCRRKLDSGDRIERIELMLEEVIKKLNCGRENGRQNNFIN